MMGRQEGSEEPHKLLAVTHKGAAITVSQVTWILKGDSVVKGTLPGKIQVKDVGAGRPWAVAV